MNYWGWSYSSTHHANWKIFWWAITASDITDCLISVQRPVGFRWWRSRLKLDICLYFRSPIRCDVPTYLIEECGRKNVNDDLWIIPF
jgi:hypothetical protein